ncbi:bifunctional metallophosphatase/5'-nucleotidase [Mobilicoccus massiliensis]|uniref:bifunctional metallophosphatase/5'-nucleotidase n=1 Tax=Mobilicoccus massiliensis TaxID=1522310 RepID=UPI0009E2F9EC|nr:bifunctional metallophosphatase/5'-nucleotidase [Mobilicoccus massiliensis]
MSSHVSRAAVVCGLAAATTLALTAAPAIAAPTGAGSVDAAPTPASASSVSASTAQPAAADRSPRSRRSARIPIQLLGINDFHGNLEPPAGSGGTVYDKAGKAIEAGGAEYLATHLKRARATAKGSSWTVSVGDNIGGSPFLSQAFYDEPTVEALNAMGVTASAVGNHELDHGWTELWRMQRGGCAPKEKGSAKQSCALHRYRGAKFPYLAANIKDSKRRNLAPYTIRTYKGARVAFIGLTLRGTPDIVSASGIKTLTFEDEVAAGNRTAAMLRRKGVKAMVALVHQGGQAPEKSPWDYRCGNGSTISGDIVPIAKGLSADIDLVMSSHSHQAYVCSIKDPAGKWRTVTQGANYGKLFTQIDAAYDPRTRDFDRKNTKAANHVVTRTVPKDRAMTALIAAYTKKVGPIASKKVGTITADVTANRAATGSTALGNLIADAQLADPSVASKGKPVIAFMNPGGIRADLTHKASMGEGDGVVTYQEAFSVQPFGNYDTSMDLTGAQIYSILGQQWSGSYPKVLQVSKGFTYEYTTDAAGKGTIVPGSVKLDGKAIDEKATYRVVANSFLADGGDGFIAFKGAKNKVTGGLDIDAFTAYLGAHSPYAPVTEQRIVKK